MLVVVVMVFALSTGATFAAEQCQAYGNGHDVYPRELKSDGYHRLHWSKAQSKCHFTPFSSLSN